VNYTTEAQATQDIVELRGAQLVAAEMKALEARKDLARLHGVRAERFGALAAARQSWENILCVELIPIVLAQGWAMQILTVESALLELAGEIAEAEGEVERTAALWSASRARVQAAEGLVRTAVRRMMRKRQEQALGDAADRLGSRPA
jgi:hypothetical protein